MLNLCQDFFARPTLYVCRDLLGCAIRREDVLLQILETEGYCPETVPVMPHRGRTRRNAPMWGPLVDSMCLCYGIVPCSVQQRKKKIGLQRY